MELKKPEPQNNNPSSQDQGPVNDYYYSQDGSPTASQYGDMGGGMYENPEPSMYDSPFQSGPEVPIVIEDKNKVPMWIFPILGLLVVGGILWMIFGTFPDDYQPGKLEDYEYKNSYFGIQITGVDELEIDDTNLSPREEREYLDRYQKKKVDEFYVTDENNDSLFFSVYNYGSDTGDGYSNKELMTELKEYTKEFVKESGGSNLELYVNEDSVDIGGDTVKGYSFEMRKGNKNIYVSQFYYFKSYYVGILTTLSISKDKGKKMISNYVSKIAGE